ncbi:MAG: 4Fe-4S dicluster domain-containing protein [Deltaproteobacteria bacterium]|nr:4Fe-4S dicluster domain-containing protein [Deltaproteobacteria bacterium]
MGLDKTLNFDLLQKCLGCGACYDLCPSSLHIEGYDPRAVIGDILQGEHEKWLEHKSIWQCLECHHCLEICYQHYGFENAMTAMRMLATKKGLNPPQVKRGWEMFAKTGRLGEPAMPARKKLNLPEPAASGKEEFVKLYEIYKKSKEAASEDKGA